MNCYAEIEKIAQEIESKLKNESGFEYIKYDLMLLSEVETIYFKTEENQKKLYISLKEKNKHFVLEVSTYGFDEEELKVIDSRCFNDLLQIINLLIESAKRDTSILEFKAFDYERIFRGGSDLCMRLIHNVNVESFYPLDIGGERIARRYLLHGQETTYTEALQGVFEGVWNLFENDLHYETKGYKESTKQGNTKGLRMDFVKHNLFYSVTLDIVENEVTLSATTNKTATQQKSIKMMGYDIFDIKSTFDLIGFDLKSAIETLTEEHALYIVVNDGLLGYSLERYIDEKVPNKEKRHFFIYSASTKRNYRKVLEFYGEVNGCKGWELSHLDETRHKYVDRVYVENIKESFVASEDNISEKMSLYKVRLNNVCVVFEAKAIEDDYHVDGIIVEFGLYDEISKKYN